MRQLDEVATRLGLDLPEHHRQALLDPSDPVHAAVVLLTAAPSDEPGSLEAVNGMLHDTRYRFPWPPFLVAFACSEKGTDNSGGVDVPPDYFAYDLRFQPARVVYLAWGRTVERNL